MITTYPVYIWYLNQELLTAETSAGALIYSTCDGTLDSSETPTNMTLNLSVLEEGQTISRKPYFREFLLAIL